MKNLSLWIILASLVGCSTIGDQQQTVEFRIFIRGFFNDPTYQISHLRFPVEYVHYQTDEPDSVLITTYLKKKDWEYFKGPDIYRCKSNCYDIIIYDNYQRRLKGNNKRVLSFEGVDNGIDTALYFEFIDGEWFLVKYEVLDT